MVYIATFLGKAAVGEDLNLQNFLMTQCVFKD